MSRSPLVFTVIVAWIAICTLVVLYANNFVSLNIAHGPMKPLPHSRISDKLENPCQCEDRHFEGRRGNDGNIHYNQTTCGPRAYKRGSHQRVVAFSFFGNWSAETDKTNVKSYFDGIKGNLEAMAKIYPNWVMRLYTNIDTNGTVWSSVCNLSCSSASLDLCHVGTLPGNPVSDASTMLPTSWRFFPTMDPQVDLLLSRDLDSRVNTREAAAVEHWLQLGKPVHVMRDHPWHGTFMLAGTWGTDLRQDSSRNNWKHTWTKMMRDEKFLSQSRKYGPDQQLLAEYVWPWARQQSVAHDSYLCQKYRGSIPFPTERRIEPNNFVGSIVKSNSTLQTECPLACRPKEHQDWIYC